MKENKKLLVFGNWFRLLFLASVLFFMFILVAYFAILNFQQEVDELIIPNLVGMDMLEAVQEIKKVNDRIEKIQQRQFSFKFNSTYDENVPKYIITKQSPIGYSKVKEGRIIELTVSLGLSQNKVPNFVGMPLKSARSIIEQDLYRSNSINKQNKSILLRDIHEIIVNLSNNVEFKLTKIQKLKDLYQSIDSLNSMDDINSTLKTYTSTLSDTFTFQMISKFYKESSGFPNFTNLKKKLIEILNINIDNNSFLIFIGDITFDYDDKLPAGYIISQDPKPNSELTNDLTINFLVNLGKNIIIVEDYKNKPIDLILPQLKTKSLIVNIKSENTQKPELDGIIAGQDVSQNTKLQSGDTINLSVYNYNLSSSFSKFNTLDFIAIEPSTVYKENDLTKKYNIPLKISNNDLLKINSDIRITIYVYEDGRDMIILDTFVKKNERIIKTVKSSSKAIYGIFLNSTLYNILKP